jgi:hypothetical protein
MHESTETAGLKPAEELTGTGRGLLGLIREAVGGSKRDFTQGSIGQAVMFDNLC